MAKWTQGIYEVKNIKKYVGSNSPKYKSSWERTMMAFLDSNDNILKWGYETMSIPYINPFTKKRSSYWPDFFVQYIDKSGKTRVDILEVKPSTQVTLENAITKKDQLAVILNAAKWEAATSFSKMKGISFRIVDETQIFHTQKKRIKKSKRK